LKKAAFLDFIMKGFIFTLVVVGLAQSLFHALVLPFPIWLTIASTVLTFLLLSVLFYNIWTSIFLVPSTIIGAVMIYRHQNPDIWYTEIIHSLDLMVEYVLGYGFLEYQNMIHLALLILILTSLIYFALIVLVEKFSFVLITGLILIGTLWYLGHVGIFIYSWSFVLGIVLLLSENHRQHISKSGSKPNFGSWQMSTIPFALAITLTASALLPADTRDFRWQMLEDVAIEINDSLWDLFGPPTRGTGFRLWQTGFAASSGRLGGPVVLNHEIALEVNSPERVLLRGAILNDYTGYGWNNTKENSSYSFSTFQSNQMRHIAFNIYEPISRIETEDFMNRISLDIAHTGLVTSILFNNNDVSNLRFNDVPLNVYFSNRGETFTSRNILPEEIYTVELLLPDRNSETFREFVNSFSSVDWQNAIPREFTSEYGLNHRKLQIIQRYYTSLPDTITERVIDLTNDVTSIARTPYEKALAIEHFLRNNLDYTLTPPIPPENVDFVDHFIFDLRIGYCTYFATAFAVMGRIAGLPTRYVEGFLMPALPTEDDLYQIRQSNAHAWAEVYFPGVGWVSFDPTPPIDVFLAEQGIIQNFPAGNVYTDFMDPYWEFMQGMWMSTSPGAGGPIPEFQPDAEIVPESNIDILASIDTILIVFASVLLLFSILTIIVLLTYRKLKQIKRDKMPTRIRFKSYYKEIIWLLSFYEYPIVKGETPYAYARRVDTWLVNEAGTFMDITEFLIESEFGTKKLTEANLATVKQFYKNLETSVKFVLGKTKYTFIACANVFKSNF